MKLSLLAIVSLLVATLGSYSQTVQWDYRVKIPADSPMIKTSSIDSSVTLPKGTVITKEINLSATRKGTITSTLKADSIIKVKHTRVETHRESDQRDATVAFDKDDRSLLRINFLIKNNTPNPDSVAYHFKLVNRGLPIKLKFSTWEAGAITIPFRYRPGFNVRGKRLSDELTTDLNLAAYVGKTNGKLTYMYRQYEEKEPNRRAWTNGLFLGLSAFEVDSSTTATARNPLTYKKKIGAVSVGYGLSYSINSFKMGLFLGSDLPIGRFAGKWDYKYLPWIGFGFGFNTNFLNGLVASK